MVLIAACAIIPEQIDLAKEFYMVGGEMHTPVASLPYVNNAGTLCTTVVINMVCVFLFQYPEGISFRGVLLDSMLYGSITTAITLGMIYPKLRKMRAMRAIPRQTPVSLFMQRLPASPVVLGCLYAGFFGILTLGINGLVLGFFGIWNLGFMQWLVYKLIFSTLMSIKIAECCIYRYIQPDWAGENTRSDHPDPSAKNPFPKISVLRAMCGSVSANIAMNIIIGSALGGVRGGSDGTVVIYPTTVQSIPITGLVFGLIAGVLVTTSVLKKMNATIENSIPAPDNAAATNRCIAWMPVKNLPLVLCTSLCVMAFSSVALWALMAFFGVSVMNFYQFTIFITAYASIISRPLSSLLVWRCLQPDYLAYVHSGAKGSLMR